MCFISYFVHSISIPSGECVIANRELRALNASNWPPLNSSNALVPGKVFSRIGDTSRYIAFDEFPVLCLRKHFASTVHERRVCRGIDPKLIHHPRRWISEISVDAVETRHCGSRTTRLAGNVVVCWPDQRPLQLQNIVRNSVVERRNRL